MFDGNPGKLILVRVSEGSSLISGVDCIIFLGSIVLTSLFSLFYVTCECNRFLHRGCAKDLFTGSSQFILCVKGYHKAPKKAASRKQ